MSTIGYIPKHFSIEELVDPITLKKYGSDFIFKNFFDSRLLIQIDRIREYFNKPITINNWKIGGKFLYRGFRPFDCNVGSKFSAHKFGRAVDFDIDGYTAQEIREVICKNQFLPQFEFITRIEDDVNWVHIDCTNINKENGIDFFKP